MLRSRNADQDDAWQPAFPSRARPQLRILVVDDDPELLADEVCEARSSEEALALPVAAHRIHMPGRSCVVLLELRSGGAPMTDVRDRMRPHPVVGIAALFSVIFALLVPFMLVTGGSAGQVTAIMLVGVGLVVGLRVLVHTLVKTTRR